MQSILLESDSVIQVTIHLRYEYILLIPVTNNYLFFSYL